MSARGSKVTVRCKRCREEFVARVADRKRGWAVFCSKSCKAIAQEARTGQHRAHINKIDSDYFSDGEEFNDAHLFSNEE